LFYTDSMKSLRGIVIRTNKFIQRLLTLVENVNPVPFYVEVNYKKKTFILLVVTQFLQKCLSE